MLYNIYIYIYIYIYILYTHRLFPVSAKTGEGVSDAILTMLSESLH